MELVFTMVLNALPLIIKFVIKIMANIVIISTNNFA